MTRTSSSKPFSSTRRNGRGRGEGGGKRFSVFDFSEEDVRVEKVSRSLLGKFSARRSSPVTKHQFLHCFGKGAKSVSRNLSDELIDIDAEVGKGANTDSFSEDISYELIHIDSEVSISTLNTSHQISPGPIDLNAEDTCADGSLEGGGSMKQEILETNDLLRSRSSTNEDDFTVIFPDFVIYEGNWCTTSKLIFSCSCIKFQGSALSGLQRTFDSEWAVSDIIGIESEWCSRVETAIVNLRLKGKHFTGAENSNDISGIELLKFSVCDPLWSESEKAIRTLNVRYNDLWNADYDDNDKVKWEEIVSWRHSDVFFPKNCFSEFVDTFEEVIYPKGDPDAVTISKRDLELLKPGMFINDTIIDFYVKYLKNKFLSEKNDRFYFFNSFFFRKLADLDKDLSSACGGRDAFQRVHKWTKKVNLFQKDYLFIPVNYSLHWSLVVICHPGEVVNLKDKKHDNLSKVPCILHMDSIKGSHRGLKSLFQSYLCEEWKERYGDGDDDEDISAVFLTLPFIPLELPQQENSFDCGLFLLHYVELFLEGAPVNFSPLKILKLSNFLSQDWFHPAEASLKRAHILKLIYEIMVCNQAKELSGSVGKYPSSDANDSDNDLSKHVSGEADIFTMTHSDNFSSVGKEFGSVSKVSSDTNYQRIGGRESVMPPIEEDENGETADSPQCLDDRLQASAVFEFSSAFSFGQQFTELEISWEGRYSQNVKEDMCRKPSPRPSLHELQTTLKLGQDSTPQATKNPNHPTEADNQLEILTSSSDELINCVVEDSEEEGNERNDRIEIEVSSSSRNNLFLSRQVVESTANFSDNNRQHEHNHITKK
ncbi:putative ubiquitin-like-specific protease 2A isoform X2 [Cucumis melo var. makuwa]|uniref:Ubiquitin-like-specific protease 2A isoform X2 n=1 Tax=Cucumis melo var. makuwa TaxID=1194695 RepID=A0A5A7SPN7_CUCMM|nr:putative ubiquitin-like-specific protease 2A isoform X2 [Cucumis melo var. makuwa]